MRYQSTGEVRGPERGEMFLSNSRTKQDADRRHINRSKEIHEVITYVRDVSDPRWGPRVIMEPLHDVSDVEINPDAREAFLPHPELEEDWHDISYDEGYPDPEPAD